MTPTQPNGYLAMPTTGKSSAVLVLHAWWGLNDTIKTFCTRLAEAGFLAFAPDLYHGKIADTIADAEILGAALDAKVDQARADIAEAVTFLKQQAESSDSGIIVIGFSLGAYYALDLSIADPAQVHSVVVFYGTGVEDFSGSKATYLGHFAEEDPYEPPASVEYLEAALERAGCPATLYTYPGTGHWFFEPDRKDAYNPAAANLAWDRTLAFLKHAATS